MCGIVGFTGNNHAAETVVEGLKRLEYRGYDSWGVASTSQGQSLQVLKRVGNVRNGGVHEQLSGNAAIGHTRWATHGGVNINNAHPHSSCDIRLAVVHNGIIENHANLKADLELKGHHFKSETDSEVIVHLVEELSKTSSLKEAVRQACNKISGNYAFLILSNHDGSIIGARNGSPLALGHSVSGTYFASDVSAFLDKTRNVLYLEDGTIVCSNGSTYEVSSISTGQPIPAVLTTVEWDVEQAKKGDFSHYMLKEIYDQQKTIGLAVSQSDKAVKQVAEKIKDAYGVFFVACGSSYHAALASSYVFSSVAKEHINVVLASEFRNYKHFLKPKTLVVAISQSGETADVIDAVNIAKEAGSQVIGIVNVMGSTLMRKSDDALMLNAGPEICVLSTKSYTSQLALLTLVAYAMDKRLEEGKQLLRQVSRGVSSLLDSAVVLKLRLLARALHEKDHLFVIGRSIHYATALEAALKIKEVSYVHAEGFAGGELKHGTLALIEEGTPCIAFVANDENKELMLSNAMEVKSRGGFIVGVSPENSDVFNVHILVPDLGEASHIANIIPIQVLAYYLALYRGCDPDRPRNLAKSVTVR